MSSQTSSGGSVRSVASSRAVARGVMLEKGLEAGDWARESTFRQFYFEIGRIAVATFDKLEINIREQYS